MVKQRIAFQPVNKFPNVIICRWVNEFTNLLCQPSKSLLVRAKLFWTRKLMFHRAWGNRGGNRLPRRISPI